MKDLVVQRQLMEASWYTVHDVPEWSITRMVSVATVEKLLSSVENVVILTTISEYQRK